MPRKRSRSPSEPRFWSSMHKRQRSRSRSYSRSPVRNSPPYYSQNRYRGRFPRRPYLSRGYRPTRIYRGQGMFQHPRPFHPPPPDHSPPYGPRSRSRSPFYSPHSPHPGSYRHGRSASPPRRPPPYHPREPPQQQFQRRASPSSYNDNPPPVHRRKRDKCIEPPLPEGYSSPRQDYKENYRLEVGHFASGKRSLSPPMTQPHGPSKQSSSKKRNPATRSQVNLVHRKHPEDCEVHVVKPKVKGEKVPQDSLPMQGSLSPVVHLLPTQSPRGSPSIQAPKEMGQRSPVHCRFGATIIPGVGPVPDHDGQALLEPISKSKAQFLAVYIPEHGSCRASLLMDERQVSLDLVHACKKDVQNQAFRSIFDHIQKPPNIEGKCEKEKFAQHVVSLVHNPKGLQLKANAPTLSERFAQQQQEAEKHAQARKHQGSPEIHRRINISPRASQSLPAEEQESHNANRECSQKKNNDQKSDDQQYNVEHRRNMRDAEQESWQHDVPRRIPRPYPPYDIPNPSWSYHPMGGFDKSRLGERPYFVPRGGYRPRGYFLRPRGYYHGRGYYQQPGYQPYGTATGYPAYKPPEEEWDPEYTPKSKKYFLHDDRDEREDTYWPRRARPRGFIPYRARARVWRRPGNSPIWEHDKYELSDEDREGDDMRRVSEDAQERHDPVFDKDQGSATTVDK
uniref:BCLAF1 and THRAP3 family member 3-like isoform X1 n=1 Tax=Myxine glutinosa TaxID=7769 RepID=UPI00358FE00B